MDRPAPSAPSPPEAIQAETLRLKLAEWRIELTAGRTVQPADPSDPDPLASEWKRYRMAEQEFWERHAGKLPPASWHTVQTPVDFYWWLLGRIECLKQLCPALIGPFHPGHRYPVPLRWINEACDLADRYSISRSFAKPPADLTPQQGLSIFDALLLETDKEIRRRNGGLPWRGPLVIAAAAQQFDRMANAFDDRGRIAAKAAHLQADVNELATQAGRLLYQAIDRGGWRGQWPWARGRKPARDLFIYKDDFSLIPSDQITEIEQNPDRFRDGERFRLPRPEVIPDEFVKPDRMASAFWIAALNVAGQYPNAFRINPHRLDATDAEGDEADRLAYWRRRADVSADACRFISTLLRQQPPTPDEPAGVKTGDTKPPSNGAPNTRELKLLATALRDLARTYHGADKDTAEAMAGANLIEAVRLGAFAGAEFVELRHVLAMHETPPDMGDAPGDKPLMDALGTPIRRAVSWLWSKKKLPDWVGGRSDLWFPDAFSALGEMIEREAATRVQPDVVFAELAMGTKRGEVLAAADELVRVVSNLRAMAHYPAGSVAKTSATERQKQDAQKRFEEWFDELGRLTDAALARCDLLLTFGGTGIGTGIREWMKRCETSHGREHDPYDDALLATVIDESQAIARLARVVAQPEPTAGLLGKTSRARTAAASRRRGRLTKDDSEAKRSHLIATIRAHMSLKDDPRRLAEMIGVSESTARRWLQDEERQYRESRAARPAEDDEE